MLPLLPTRRLCLLLLEWWWLLCDLRERTNSFHAALFSVGDLAVRKLVMAACCLELSGLLLVLLGGGVRCNEGEWGVLRGVDSSETCVSSEGESVIVLGILGSLTIAAACCCLGEGMSGGVDGRIGVVDENVVLLCGGDRLSNGRTAAAAAVEDFSVVASFILLVVVSLNLKEILGDGGVDGKL